MVKSNRNQLKRTGRRNMTNGYERGKKKRKQKMSERDVEFSDENCFLAPLTTLLNSFKIFSRNFRLFFSIFALTTLPLSLLLFSLSLSSHPIKSQIYNLEALAMLAPKRFEARHVWQESGAEALSLLRHKALFFVPCYALSLLAAITTVSSTALSCSGKCPNLETAVTAVRATWRRPLATTICVYAIMLAYIHILRTLAALLGTAVLRFLVVVSGAVLEVYLMAVTSLGVVVSIVEEQFGCGSIRVGSDLMKGRRFCGWLLSGLFVLNSGLISYRLEGLMYGQDWTRGEWTVVVGLIFLFGLVVLWSYIVTSVFYCECKKRHVIREDSEMV